MATVKITSDLNSSNEVTIVEYDPAEGILGMTCAKGMWCTRPGDWDARFGSWNDMINLADNHVAHHDAEHSQP